MDDNLVEELKTTYYDKSYVEKRNILREYSTKNAISNYITVIMNCVLKYGENNKFCKVNNDMFTDKDLFYYVNMEFNTMYNKLGFHNRDTALSYLRKFIVDGYLSLEIIYNNEHTHIIGFKELDPATLEYDHIENKWIQHSDNETLKRVLLDSQIIYLTYKGINGLPDLSYVEPLIRPYNLYKITEEASLMYAVKQARTFKKFIVPVDGQSKAQARQTIAEMIEYYYDKIQLDSMTGELSINGSSNIPYETQYYLPTVNEQFPEVDMLSSSCNNMVHPQFYLDSLRRASFIPFINKESYDDEMKYFFNLYTKSIYSVWMELITKPIYIQLCLSNPDLINMEDLRYKITCAIQ